MITVLFLARTLQPRTTCLQIIIIYSLMKPTSLVDFPSLYKPPGRPDFPGSARNKFFAKVFKCLQLVLHSDHFVRRLLLSHDNGMYRIYLPRFGKLLHTKHVLFNENTFPAHEEAQGPSPEKVLDEAVDDEQEVTDSHSSRKESNRTLKRLYPLQECRLPERFKSSLVRLTRLDDEPIVLYELVSTEVDKWQMAIDEEISALVNL